MNRRFVVAMSAAALAALLSPAALRPSPRLVWNVSASAPLGGYRVQPGRALAVGDYVVIRPPAPLAGWMVERGYVGRDMTLLKRVAALAPSRVCRFGHRVTIDGATAATARERDRFGRPLPFWSGCRSLAEGEVFALNDTPDSFDGRYFGVLPGAILVGRAEPRWTSEARP